MKKRFTDASAGKQKTFNNVISKLKVEHRQELESVLQQLLQLRSSLYLAERQHNKVVVQLTNKIERMKTELTTIKDENKNISDDNKNISDNVLKEVHTAVVLATKKSYKKRNSKTVE